MNSFISKATLEARRARYKKGVRVELISMTDPYTKLKPGDIKLGTAFSGQIIFTATTY